MFCLETGKFHCDARASKDRDHASLAAWVLGKAWTRLSSQECYLGGAALGFSSDHGSVGESTPRGGPFFPRGFIASCTALSSPSPPWRSRQSEDRHWQRVALLPECLTTCQKMTVLLSVSLIFSLVLSEARSISKYHIIPLARCWLGSWGK